MRVLVTGGAGFIGSHLVDALLARGDLVLVLDDLSSGRRTNLGGALEGEATLSVGQLEDGEFVAGQVAGLEPELVFHLGAQVDVRKAVDAPAVDAEINIGGTIKLLEAVRQHTDGAPVIFASTGGAIYGEGEGRNLPFDESAATEPGSAYGTSKLAAELYLQLYRRLHRISSVAMRLGNVYGPRQDPHGEAGVVAIFCGLLREGRPLRVFGDGRQTRDYVFVADVVAALLSAGRVLTEANGDLAGPLNVGTGIETSVLELVDALQTATGTEATVEHRPARPGEVQRVSIDPAAAGRAIGWRAETTLPEGLARTCEALALES